MPGALSSEEGSSRKSLRKWADEGPKTTHKDFLGPLIIIIRISLPHLTYNRIGNFFYGIPIKTTKLQILSDCHLIIYTH